MARTFPNLELADEEAIVARGRSIGPERDAALEEIFRLFRESILSLCLHIVGDRAEAEDVVQHVFLSVHGALPYFRHESRLSTWIYRIAIRAAVAARARRRELTPLDDQLLAPNAEHDLQVRDQTRRVADAMDRLSIDHRTVLSLFAIDGLSHREIADVLGVPEGTVWSRLSAARKKLNEELRLRPARRAR